VGAQASCKLGLSMNAPWDSIHPVPQHHVAGSSTQRMTQSPRLESTHTGCKFLIVTHGAYILYDPGLMFCPQIEEECKVHCVKEWSAYVVSLLGSSIMDAEHAAQPSDDIWYASERVVGLCGAHQG
jgi:hypothetical protein